MNTNPARQRRIRSRRHAAAADRAEDGERGACVPEAGTPPPQRSRASRSQFVVFMNFLMTSLMFCRCSARAWLVYFGKRAFDGPGPAATSRPLHGQAEHRRRRNRATSSNGAA